MIFSGYTEINWKPTEHQQKKNKVTRLTDVCPNGPERKGKGQGERYDRKVSELLWFRKISLLFVFLILDVYSLMMETKLSHLFINFNCFSFIWKKDTNSDSHLTDAEPCYRTEIAFLKCAIFTSL